MDRHQVVGLPPRLRKPPLQKFVEGLQVLQPPVLPRPDLAEIAAQFHELGVALGLFPLLPRQNLVDFLSTNSARSRLSFGGMGGFLVIKLVKPTKVFCSWTPHQVASTIPASQTQPHIRATAAGVLGEADAAVRQELGRLDSADRVLYQVTKFLALFLGDGGSQVLDFDQALRTKTT